MIQKGDKVRFIDEALEGVVTNLIGKDRAEIMTNDGFTMIVLLNQLVKVRDEKQEKGMLQKEEAPSQEKEEKQPPKPQRTEHKGKIFSFDEAALKEEMVYAAFEVIEPQSPMTSAVQLYLVNNTNASIAFSLSKKYEMRDEGIAIERMEARSVKSFLTYTQEELKLFESFRLQVIFYPDSKSVFRPPLQKLFKFNAEDLLESQDFIFGKTNSLFVSVADLKQPSEIDITPLVNRFGEKEKASDKPAQTKKSKPSSISKNIIYSNEKVVDLHIEELIKDFTAMSNGQIISHQLKHFQYEMDQAIVRHLARITFIHGVGAGVLKIAIREELKKFSNIKFGDAPQEKYGYGATEVIFI